MGPRSVVSVLCASAVALVVVLVPAAARADRHTGGVGGGGNWSGRSSLWGATLSGDWIPSEGDWPCRPLLDTGTHGCTLGLAGEIGGAQGDHEGGTLTQYSFQAGPRFTRNVLPRFQPFLVALAGVTVEKIGGRSDTSFSTALGFGADVPVSSEEHPVWVVRGQATWNWIDNGRSDDSYWQVGFSLTYRFERPRAELTKKH